MTSSLAAPTDTAFHERVIGRLRADAPGPMLVVVGSLHGNEPAGAAALGEVVFRLSRERLLVRGDLLALVGNLSALERGVRFVDEDLNRRWGRECLDRLRRGEDEAFGAVEDKERVALLEKLEQGFHEARGRVVLLDLHTTSGEGKPFAIFADTLRSRDFARRFPLPLVLGLEEQLDDTLADYVALLGHVAVAFEGGQHGDFRSAEALEDVVWIALGDLGMVEPGSTGVGEKRKRLVARTRGVPRVLEVVYRHAVDEDDGFRMRPGHRSFEPVVAGQVIADDGAGDVAVPSGGFLLMPLYQKQGDDGFFVVRRVLGIWLLVSAVLRTLRAGRVAHWLPGISRLPGEPHALRVDRKVARWYSLQLLHLLGFRRRTEEGDTLIVERRAHDLP